MAHEQHGARRSRLRAAAGANTAVRVGRDSPLPPERADPDTDPMNPDAGAPPALMRDLEADRRRERRWNIATTTVALVLLIPAVLGLAWMGLWVQAVTGQCSTFNVCNDGLIIAGTAVAMLAPIVLWFAAVVVSIVLIVRERWAWWVAPVALVVAYAVQWLGSGIAQWGANWP
nr:DUF6264 family protein [Agromyces sp. LHK192]